MGGKVLGIFAEWELLEFLVVLAPVQVTLILVLGWEFVHYRLLYIYIFCFIHTRWGWFVHSGFSI